eukprot:5338709-Pyramimonas_sp.AAC.1
MGKGEARRGICLIGALASSTKQHCSARHSARHVLLLRWLRIRSATKAKRFCFGFPHRAPCAANRPPAPATRAARRGSGISVAQLCARVASNVQAFFSGVLAL